MTPNKIRLITATIYALKSQLKQHNFIKNNNLKWKSTIAEKHCSSCSTYNFNMIAIVTP